MGNRLVKAVTLLHVEVFVVLICQLAFIFAPDRNHAVHGLFFFIFLKFTFSVLFRTMSGYIHFDWISNKIRVFLNDRLQSIFIQILVIAVIFRIFFNGQNDFRTYGRFVG
ncbi:hypothetical protein D3C80_1597900 [compost metagenome]